MNWIRNKQQWRDYLLITLGTAVMAVATSSIYDPAGLVTGGFSGLAIVIKQLSQMLFGKGVPLWVTNLVLNIPLFLFGIRMSRDFPFSRCCSWCRMTGCFPHCSAAF